jgi:hypothetical protein
MCSGYSQCLTHNLPLAQPQKELEAAGKKLKELQDDLAAVQFTPHSKNGKLLMAKCRTLQDENSEIGREASEGKLHDLGTRLAMQKSLNVELRRCYEELYKSVGDVNEELERSQQMVCFHLLSPVYKLKENCNFGQDRTSYVVLC